jgi:protein-tyrosine-phosphatase
MSDHARYPYNVLFLCTGNSARSIMAEAILNRAGLPKFRAYSAGSHPKGGVNPHVLAFLERRGFRTDDLRSKSWTEFAAPGAPRLDFVFTVCAKVADEVCPAWPGQPITTHWDIPEPVLADSSGIARVLSDIYRLLEDRITDFCVLPFASLDAPSLKKRLGDIGSRYRHRGAAA